MSLQYEKEPEEIEPPDEQNEEVQRATAVFPLYSVISIACLVTVFLFQLTADGTNSVLFGGNASGLLAGFVKKAFADGQYWRILTGAVLHGGLVHLAFNCYALYILGKLIETLSNRAHLIIIFLLAAIGGNTLSFIFLPNDSVGASGGILGFLGYLTVYGFLRRKLLSNDFLKNMLFNVGFIAFTGIFVLPNVDNFGHLGGLIVGAIYGLLQIPRDLHRDPREVGENTKFVGIAALGIFIVISIFSILILLRIV